MKAYLCGGAGIDYAREYWGLNLGHWTSVDLDADMGYIRLREHRRVYRTDTSLQNKGVLLDRGVNDELLGIELFLHDGQLRSETRTEVKRLLAKFEHGRVSK